MKLTRSGALATTLGLAAVVALFAWAVGSNIESPAEAAARTVPPQPAPILVPIERRVLSSTIVTRGTGRFGLPHQVSIGPSTLKPGPGLIARLPARNAPVQEGTVLMIASGRPVFVFAGSTPAFRDLGPGIAGEDVRQLESALQRLGFDPGQVDGIYDQRTATAVERFYAARKWEPFGPTREQIANLATLERQWAEAEKTRVAAAATAAAASLAVDAARAAADHAVSSASVELAGKPDAPRANDETSLALEAERARAAHGERAAQADLQAQIAERALIVLDPRQPAGARDAAEAKVELARAALRKARLEGELAMQVAERAARQSAAQKTLAESALRSARLDGRKAVQAALDAQRLADIDARLSAEQATRFAGELAAARRRIGTQVPLDEIVFVPSLPVRVETVTATVGGNASGPVLTLTDNQLAIDSSLTLENASLVRAGMAVAIDEPDLGVRGKGVVEQVAATPGTRGVDGYHVYFEVRVTETVGRIEGVSVRLTIPTESTQGAVLAVPTSALSLSADGSSRVQVQDKDGLRYVTVQPGLSSSGYVEIGAGGGGLQAGQMVVIGYKGAMAKEAAR